MLDIEFDRVKQHMYASKFSSQTGVKDLASPQVWLEIKGCISLARMSLAKLLCMIQSDDLCLNGLE